MDLYATLVFELWEIVSAMLGEAVLALLFSLSLKHLKERYPFLGLVEVSEEGVDLSKVREECLDLSPTELHKGFQGLVNHLLNLFSALTEGVISREVFPKVFPRIREAERLVSQK
ncbi:MAG: hypothetical protein N3G78_10200 [Desulfobacterota bacterium]|nr:hypothetical protein [Thermodesulfobacteriota bacterium]